MSANRTLKLTPITDIHWLTPVVNNAVQKSLFASIFGFHESTMTQAVLQGTAWHFVLFPFAAVTEIVWAVISGINLSNAQNKNYSRVLQLVWDILKALLVSTVVLGGIVATAVFAAITPIAFTVLMATMTLKDLGLTIWNLSQWFMHRNDIDPALASHYKAEAWKTFLDTVLNGLVTASIVCLMLSPVGPVAGAAMSIITTSGLLLSAIYGVIQGVPALREPWTRMTNWVKGLFSKSDEDKPRLSLYFQESIYNEKDISLDSEDHSSKEEKRLDKEECLVDSEVLQRGSVRQSLTGVIDDKIRDLGRQINEGSSSSISNYLFQQPQEKKRRGKIAVLTKYKDMINDDISLNQLDNMFDVTKPEYNNKANEKFRNKLAKYAHQSFWSPDHQGGVETISRQVESYLRKN